VSVQLREKRSVYRLEREKTRYSMKWRADDCISPMSSRSLSRSFLGSLQLLQRIAHRLHLSIQPRTAQPPVHTKNQQDCLRYPYRKSSNLQPWDLPRAFWPRRRPRTRAKRFERCEKVAWFSFYITLMFAV
jgi:hypothetical protein